MEEKTLATQSTTDSFAVLDENWNSGNLARKTIVIQNEGSSNSIDYRIQGSLDETNWITIVTSTALANSTLASENINNFWKYLRVQVRATTGGSQSTVSAEAAGIGA